MMGQRAQEFKKGTGSSLMWTSGYMPTSHGSPGSGESCSEFKTLACHTGAAEGSGRRSPALQDLPHSATKGAAMSDQKKEVDETTGSVRCVWACNNHMAATHVEQPENENGTSDQPAQKVYQ